MIFGIEMKIRGKVRCEWWIRIRRIAKPDGGLWLPATFLRYTRKIGDVGSEEKGQGVYSFT